MKKLLTISAVMAMIFLSGCGEESSTCRIDVQRDIDKGNFQSAISKLDGSCKSAFTPSDRLYNLATAYMGESGYGVSDVIKIMVEADDNNDDNGFTTFTKSVSKNRKENSLDLLGQAKTLYLRSIEPDSNDTKALLSQYCRKVKRTDAPYNSRIQNACFYAGFSDIVKSGVALTQLTNNIDDALKAIEDNNVNEIPLDMKANMDALAWAIGAEIQNGSTIEAKAIRIKNIAFKHLQLSLDGETFYRLAQENAPNQKSSTILTSGYCDINGSKTPCEGIENEDGSIDTTKPAAASCYACPISFESNTSSTVTEMLVDTLNSGLDSIDELTNDEEIKDSVRKFKKEITGSEDGNVTVDNIIDYLNAKK